jgi:hypothetical protein
MESAQVQLSEAREEKQNATVRLGTLQGQLQMIDSQLAETQNNATAFVDLRENLKANWMTLGHMPLVIQFNKRDLPAIRTDTELAELAAKGKEPVFRAVATAGQGVLETLTGLLHLTYSALDAEHHLSKKFKLDSKAILSEVISKLGGRSSIDELLGACVGGALTVLAPDAGLT